MEKYTPKAGDIVTLNATIAAVASDGGLIITLNSGLTIVVSESDINTICPKIEIPEKDMRTGR